MNHGRTGKVARLSQNIRNHLNEFLDDGLEYQRVMTGPPKMVSWALPIATFPAGTTAAIRIGRKFQNR